MKTAASWKMPRDMLPLEIYLYSILLCIRYTYITCMHKNEKWSWIGIRMMWLLKEEEWKQRWWHCGFDVWKKWWYCCCVSVLARSLILLYTWVSYVVIVAAEVWFCCSTCHIVVWHLSTCTIFYYLLFSLCLKFYQTMCKFSVIYYCNFTSWEIISVESWKLRLNAQKGEIIEQ